MHLVIVTPGPVPCSSDHRRVEISDKFISGVLEYAKSWPGDITVVAETRTGADTNIGSSWRELERLPFALLLATDVRECLNRARPDVALVGLTPSSTKVMSAARRTVVVAELPLVEQLKVAWAERTSGWGFVRNAQGLGRRERGLRSLIRESSGIQCNGHPAYEAFAPLNERAMLFYDTRLTSDDMDVWEAKHFDEGPLRLGFSGLYERHKGPEYAVRLSKALTALQYPFSLTMLGDGSRADELRDIALGTADVRPPLPFRPDWLSYVSQHVDLMLLPHVQGDPAGTYLETAGLGVPVLGFDNAALASLTQFGFGWAVRMRDERALLDAVMEIDQDRPRLREAGKAGRQFMRAHTFEQEFGRRVEHLLTVAHH